MYTIKDFTDDLYKYYYINIYKFDIELLNDKYKLNNIKLDSIKLVTIVSNFDMTFFMSYYLIDDNIMKYYINITYDNFIKILLLNDIKISDYYIYMNEYINLISQVGLQEKVYSFSYDENLSIINYVSD